MELNVIQDHKWDSHCSMMWIQLRRHLYHFWFSGNLRAELQLRLIGISFVWYWGLLGSFNFQLGWYWRKQAALTPVNVDCWVGGSCEWTQEWILQVSRTRFSIARFSIDVHPVSNYQQPFQDAQSACHNCIRWKSGYRQITRETAALTNQWLAVAIREDGTHIIEVVIADS